MHEIKPARLRIAMAIYRLHPRGGLEDNCLRVVEILRSRGHDVTVFTAVNGEAPGIKRICLPQAATRRSNHKRMHTFARDARQAVGSGGFDRSVAFQMMPGFDVLFLADNIRNKSAAPFWQRFSPRFRTFASLEKEVFSPGSKTKVIGLSGAQMEPFETVYGPQTGRIVIAPPTISPAKHKPESRTGESRAALRGALDINANSMVFLAMCLMPEVKGLDRTIEALGNLPDAHVLVAGISGNDKKARAIVAQAKRLGVENRVHWLGYLSGEQLFSAMAASDVLAHPARTEVTGAVILEAVINGLPVVATSLCGFAHHIEKAQAGHVIGEPFSQKRYQETLLMAAGQSLELSANGIRYGMAAELFDGLQAVADWIETGPVHEGGNGANAFSKNIRAEASQDKGR